VVWRIDLAAGASPLFPPQYPDAEAACDALLELLRQDPEAYGFERVRWTLQMLLTACQSWLRLRTLGGMCQLLKRLDIVYKQGREHVHSPDPEYGAKVEAIKAALTQVRADPEHKVLLYLDEVTYYRQSTKGKAYTRRGRHQARAEIAPFVRNVYSRVLGAMDVMTGKVVFEQQKHITVPCLTRFWQALRKAYPKATTIYVVLDNWPVHYHVDVLASLERQSTPFALKGMSHWPKEPTKKRKQSKQPKQPLPIQLLPLPTYSPWLNPIEKLWLRLTEDVLRMHRHSDNWNALRSRVVRYLEQFADGSEALLRSTGLAPKRSPS
jgi:hypothetical protein